MKKRPTAIYVPARQAIHEAFTLLDRHFAGLPVTYRPSTREAIDLLCLVARIPVSDWLSGNLTRQELHELTMSAAALCRMDIAFVELVWPPESTPL